MSSPGRRTDGITDANDRFLEMLGYTREDVETGRWVGWASPRRSGRTATGESLKELRTTGRNAAPFEKEYYRKDGSRLPILVTAAALDEEGQHGVGLILDITDQKRAESGAASPQVGLEDRVRRRTSDLEAANAELESFATRCPTTCVHRCGTCRVRRLLAESWRDDDDEVRHFLHRIRQSAAEMSVLIDDLLAALARRACRHARRAGRHGRLVDDVVELLRSDLDDRHVDVSVGEVLPVAGDRTLLRQVWANLLGNAFKYTRPRDPATIEVGSRQEGGETVYWVRDNGVGFDMHYVDRLFRVFERLHRSEEFEGTGIGLANVSAHPGPPRRPLLGGVGA